MTPEPPYDDDRIEFEEDGKPEPLGQTPDDPDAYRREVNLLNMLAGRGSAILMTMLPLMVITSMIVLAWFGKLTQVFVVGILGGACIGLFVAFLMWIATLIGLIMADIIIDYQAKRIKEREDHDGNHQ